MCLGDQVTHLDLGGAGMSHQIEYDRGNSVSKAPEIDCSKSIRQIDRF